MTVDLKKEMLKLLDQDEAFLQERFDLDYLRDALVEKFGLSESQAENIVRTEMANIFNKMREWAYREESGASKFVWVSRTDACELYKRVEKLTAGECLWIG
ncbi:MAG: hypothetical protein QXH35_07965 [Nitrososphaerota archaeon]